MLGFDAVGRLAVGQVANVTGINPILTANAGSFTESGVAAAFNISQPSSAGAYSLTGTDTLTSIGFVAAGRFFSVIGTAASFKILTPGNNTSYVLTGNSAFLGAGGFQATTGSFTVNGGAVTFSVSVSGSAASEPGSFVVTGKPASFILNRNAWIERPFETGAWTAKAKQAETWTPVIEQSEVWTPE